MVPRRTAQVVPHESAQLTESASNLAVLGSKCALVRWPTTLSTCQECQTFGLAVVPHDVIQSAASLALALGGTTFREESLHCDCCTRQSNWVTSLIILMTRSIPLIRTVCSCAKLGLRSWLVFTPPLFAAHLHRCRIEFDRRGKSSF